MADISILSRLVNSVQRGVDISSNTLVTLSVKVGGGVSNTELTKAILDRLVSLQNGATNIDDTYHAHDTLYTRTTALASTAGGTAGSTLIGDDDTYSNFSPISATVKGALEGIDAVLGSAATALDGTFRIKNTSDVSKQLAFNAAAISASTTRTITMPDADVDLGALTNSNISASAAIALTKLAALTANRALISNGSGVIAPSSVSNTELGYLVGATSSIQTQINNLSSSIQNFEWQPSVISAVLLTPPVSPSTGDRYLIDGVGTDDWASHDNEIAQWDGVDWVFTTPSTGTFVAADDEPNKLYLFGGSVWTSKYFESTTASTGLTKVGFDIRLDSSAAGDGLAFTTGVLSVLASDASIVSGVSGISVAKDAAGAIVLTGSGLAVQLESSNPTLQIATNRLGVKLDSARAITTGANGIGVNIDAGTMAIVANALKVKDAGISATQLATGAFDQDTILGGAGTAASVQKAPLVSRVMVAGESMTANVTVAVRMAVSGETAGRVYKADNDASSSDKFWAIGLVSPTGAVSAGGNVTVIALGHLVLGSGDTAFASGDVGKPVWLGASGAFVADASFTPSANQASFKLGMVESTSSIWVDRAIMGVN